MNSKTHHKLKAAVEQIIEMYRSGMSLKQLGNHFECSHTSIKNVLLRNKVVLRTKSEGTKIAVNDPVVKEKRASKLRGKPGSTKGIKYKLKHRRFNPGSKGEKNSQWKGGKTKLSRLIRELPEYKAWRTAVFVRDSHTCVLCGNKSCAGNKVVINADHITPLSKLLDECRIDSTDAALKCEALWDVTNGRTLCEDCHRQTDTFGNNLPKKTA